jgi:peptidoglycan-associated lipoprotein
MLCRKLLGGVLGGLAAASVSGLHLNAAWAEDRMQHGIAAAELAEFQSQVGDRVFFGQASADLGARGRIALEAQAVWLARHPRLSVIIEGHADDSGADAQNLEVSERRAQTVCRRLIQMGVAPERIRTVAYGRERLIADCHLPACAAQNRRAVTVIGPSSDTAKAASGPEPALRATAARRSPRRLN